MINTGYLFSNEPSRLFINTSLGCNANCSYCYLPTLNLSKGIQPTNYKSAEYIIDEVSKYKDFKLGIRGTLISFGCYSECWDEKNKPETIKLIKYFLDLGNQVQFATKKYVDYNDLKEISKFIKYPGQLVIFISSATITNEKIYEKNTTPTSERFKSFEILSKLNIPMALYIKPVLPNVTIQDIDKYISIIKEYNIKDVIVGSIIKTNGTGEVAPFVNDNSMHTAPIKDEEIIRERLRKYCNVYAKSTHFLEAVK